MDLRSDADQNSAGCTAAEYNECAARLDPISQSWTRLRICTRTF